MSYIEKKVKQEPSKNYAMDELTSKKIKYVL